MLILWDSSIIVTLVTLKRMVKQQLIRKVFTANLLYSPEVSQPNKGDSHYTPFRHPRFRISAVLFQYHEEHQYPTRPNFKAYYLRRTFSRLIRKCDADDKLSIKEFWR
jgi:hypothetical protein